MSYGTWYSVPGTVFGLIKDVAGNVVEVVTENLPKVAQAVAITGLIAVGGIMMSCDTTVGSNPGNTKPPIEQPEPEKEWNWDEIAVVDVGRVVTHQIQSNYSQFSVTNAITDRTVAVAKEVADMYTNLKRYTPEAMMIQKGLPDETFRKKIERFASSFFTYGDNQAFDSMVEVLVPHIGENDRELFVAYVNALRGINWASSRHDVTDDYTKTINLGNGPVSVGDLLGDINNKNGESGTDFQLDGPYPRDGIRTAMSSILSNDVYGKLTGDVVTEMESFEQLLGLLARAQSFGKDIKFSEEALNAFGTATGFVLDDIYRIDLMRHENVQVNESGI